jgi:GNAT superfamily N-acetyltransferase
MAICLAIATNVGYNMLSNDTLRNLDLAEAAAWGDMYRYTPHDVATACGVGIEEYGSAVAGSVSGVDVLAFNRVVALGLAEPASEEGVDRVIDFYATAGVSRFFVQLHPDAQPAELPQWLEARGLTHYNNWVKLHRGTQPVDDAATDLKVRQIDEDAAATFAKIVKDSFEWPDPVESLVACLVGRPNWLHYIAYDGNAPAATAALFVHRECGWLDFAATLPGYRGRGGQNALIARRIHDAAERGVKHLIVETAEAKPERPSPSYRNIVRFGFETAYVRPNFLWTNQ